MTGLRYFSTFTGIGGLDYGLEKIKAKCVGFSEIKDSSIEIYNKHYPKHENFGDITDIDIKEMPDFDILTGGFPCQSFSLAGMRKGFKDKRGQMIFYLHDILKIKKPKYFVFENVKGLMTHNRGTTLKNVFCLLSSAGYSVRIILLNSANYGSAQGRERVLLLGRYKEDFDKLNPDVIDNTKRFRDIRSEYKETDLLSEITLKRLNSSYWKGFEIIGGYDRVNTLTTGVSSSGRRLVITQTDNGDFRRITELEAERLQGFTDGWTEGFSKAKRWFALGNAVNCKMSEYLFTNYLKKVWW